MLAKQTDYCWRMWKPMRTRNNNPTMSKSLSWPKAKTVVKKWLNLKDSEFSSDDCIIDESFGGAKMRRRKSCSDRDDLSGGWLVDESSADDDLRRPPLPRPRPQYGRSPSPAVPSSTWRPPKELRMFVGTWNVGGRAPHGGLDLSDWLTDDDGPDSSSPHIYVLGFQEIVPLNAGNVLGAEDKAPARKWLDLIRRALNGPAASNTTTSTSSTSSSRSRQSSPSATYQLQKGSRVSFSDLLAAAEDDESQRPSTASTDPDDDDDPSSTTESSSEDEPPPVCGATRRRDGRHHYYRYRLAASKQMVGILLCVWVRTDAVPSVTAVRASCVGRGVMGYLGNKGSVSVSLSLRGGGEASSSSMCFVCTHLASGDRDGDGARRNGDVAEILKRTRFPRRAREDSTSASSSPVTTILEHDKVIWLGDLNYRLLVEGGGTTRELVERHEWAALLERDELRAEKKAGRVFAAGGGWEEGRIAFPPTYKFVAGSDAYAMTTTSVAGGDGSRSKDSSRKKKKRTPAWCDRILWRGEGIEQRWYARGESRFSDHRPVAALFSARLGGCGADDGGGGDKPAPAAHSSRF